MARDKRIKKIESRGKVRYRATIDVGQGYQRQQMRRTFDTIKQAELWIAKTVTDRAAGEIFARQGKTLSQACDEWVAYKEALGTLRPKTLSDYRTALNKFTRPLGDRPAQSIQPSDVEEVILEMVAMGLTQRTISYNRGILQQVFDRLVRHKVVPANPVLAIDVAGAGRQSASLVAYTSDQLAQISALVYSCEDELSYAFALTLHGLRLSEVMGLRFRDISPDGKVSIARSRVHVSKAVSGIGAPKSARSARDVKLDPRAWALLKAERRRRRVMDDFVVADAAGQPMRPETYSDRWKKFISKTDLPVYDLRIVRRSVETSMRDHGVPVHVTAAVMGHSEAMSMRHYTTAHQARMDDAMDILIKSLGGGS